MAKGMYLCIGLNHVDNVAYGGWTGKLNACENDAEAMAEIAEAKGFAGMTLLTAAATSTAVLESILNAARALVAGDILMITYSGHGGQVGDATGDEKDDGLDETWVLYDRQLIDDELRAMWAKFKDGVRVLVFSDSCHSGTVVKNDVLDADEPKADDVTRDGCLPKAMPSDKALDDYADRRVMYDGLQYVSAVDPQTVSGASVLQISACQDNQLALDGPVGSNSRFTKALIDVWNKGAFAGNYDAFNAAIRQRTPKSQIPSYLPIGVPSAAFEAQTPFTI